MSEGGTPATAPVFSAADIGALAHLYRGEVYRSTVWRTRLDTTTNWAVVTTGIALSLTFSSAASSPLPLALVGLLGRVFLIDRGAALPLLRLLAPARPRARAAILRPDPARPGHADRQRLEPNPLPGLPAAATCTSP